MVGVVASVFGQTEDSLANRLPRRFVHGLGVEARPEYVFPTHPFLRGENPERKLIRGAFSTHFKYALHYQPGSICLLYTSNGDDGVFNMPYYDLLVGMDLTAFPSYYEPWGYTPLESLAFKVPTITTTLAGFGLWVKEHYNMNHPGIEVIHREDGCLLYTSRCV